MAASVRSTPCDQHNFASIFRCHSVHATRRPRHAGLRVNTRAANCVDHEVSRNVGAQECPMASASRGRRRGRILRLQARLPRLQPARRVPRGPIRGVPRAVAAAGGAPFPAPDGEQDAVEAARPQRAGRPTSGAGRDRLLRGQTVSLGKVGQYGWSTTRNKLSRN
jgi:hypothetical protein